MKDIFDLTVKDIYKYLYSLKSSDPIIIRKNGKEIKDFLDAFKISYRIIGAETYQIYGILNINYINGHNPSKKLKVSYFRNRKLLKSDMNKNYYEYAVDYIRNNYESDMMMYDLTF